MTSVKALLFLLVIAISSHVALAQKYGAFSEDVKQVLFLGNSITYSGEYLAYLETIYRLAHPESDLDWINLGLPSETVSGLSEVGHAGGKFPRPDLHERLDRIFSSIRPDLVFVNYGMNDGIYLPYNSARFTKYAEGMYWLDAKIKAIGAQAIFLTPPIYDPSKGLAYATTLDQYAAWLIDQKDERNWTVIDLHFPMKAYLASQRQMNPSFYLAKDGVHPGETGHWLMAKAILEYFGFSEFTSAQTFQESMGKFPKGLELYSLIFQKQRIMRDAYLSETGHLRPGLADGLPLIEAQNQVELLENQIHDLLDGR